MSLPAFFYVTPEKLSCTSVVGTTLQSYVWGQFTVTRWRLTSVLLVWRSMRRRHAVKCRNWHTLCPQASLHMAVSTLEMHKFFSGNIIRNCRPYTVVGDPSVTIDQKSLKMCLTQRDCWTRTTSFGELFPSGRVRTRLSTESSSVGTDQGVPD
jgi:hypothetical protein